MITLFAHGEEVHADSTEAAGHILEEWYVWLPLWLLLMAVLVGGVYFATRRNGRAAFLALMAGLFVTGVGSYKFSPTLSVVALAAGFLLALAQMLETFSHPPAKKKE